MYSGVVRTIKSNPFGSKILHSFQLDSDRTYYNLGDRAPTFGEGVTIQFTGKPGTRAGSVNVDFNSIQVVNETPVQPKDYAMTQAAGARRTVVGIDKDQYWKNREDNDKVTQKRIEIQAARNAAIAVLGPAKDALEDESYMTSLKQLTDHFLADNEKRLNG